MSAAQHDRLAELERQYAALRARTAALFDAYPDMIFRLDGDGRFLDFHASDRRHLAAAPEDFLGRKIGDVLGAGFAATALEVIRRALTTRETQTWEYSLPLGGQKLDFESRIVPSGDWEVLSVVRDITEQRRAQEYLRLTESRLNEAQAVAKVGSWERELPSNEVWWSDETFRLFGFEPGKTVPTYERFLERLHPEDRISMPEALAEAIAHRRPYSAHHRVIRPDGTCRTLLSRAHAVLDAKGNPVRLVGTIQDVTERVELEREILAAGERERERVGRDLHDGLGQTLTGVSLILKALTNRLERGQEAPLDMLRQLESSVQEAMNETRRVVRLLSPRLSGLGPALEALVRQFDRNGLRCTIDRATAHERHDSDIETHLYRIAQEALSNAVKHSRARHIELRYRCDGKRIRLEVVDDGIGLPALQETEGIGLRNIRYRVHMLNGHLDVEDRPGGGTRVACSCPCRSEQPETGAKVYG